MLGRVFFNLRNVKHLKATLSEKVKAFIFLTSIELKDRFYKKDRIVTGQVFNYKISAYRYYTLGYLFNDVFVTENYYFKSSSDSPVIIDCGANIGMSLIYFKRLYPNAKVLAFEANPSVFKLLSQNIIANDFKDVQPYNFALFDEETVISFFVGDDLGSLVGSIQRGRDGSKELKVPTTRLSQYIRALGKVNIVKMDVEGAEGKIIDDLVSASVLGLVNEYIIEYHHNIKGSDSKFSSFLKIFEDHGYQYNMRAGFDQLDSFQDIIVHFYKVKSQHNISSSCE